MSLIAKAVAEVFWSMIRPFDIALFSATRLAMLIKPDGRFVYRYDGRTKAPGRGYNLLRHAGCIWSLNLMAQAAPGAAAAISEASRRAMTWLIRERIVASPQGGLAVVEDGAVKLGANALALLALLSLPEVMGSSATAQVAQGLVRAMLTHWNDERGDFDHKWDLETGEAHRFRSDYYTGEALLALVAYYEAVRDERILDMVQQIILAYRTVRYGVAQQSHWMAYALEALHRHRPNDALIDYGTRIMRDILDKPVYRGRQRSTPIACRSEALLAFVTMARRAGTVSTDLLLEIHRALVENLRMQAQYLLPDGGFRIGHEGFEVRIDYLQHNLTAFQRYAALYGEQLPD